jgi:hypothetical protein
VRTERVRGAAFRDLVRRPKVYAVAPRREDFGIAQLEALADGCLLVTTPAGRPLPAAHLARELDPRWSGDDLGAAIRTALDDPVAGLRRARGEAAGAVPAPRRWTARSPSSSCRACSARPQPSGSGAPTAE